MLSHSHSAMSWFCVRGGTVRTREAGGEGKQEQVQAHSSVRARYSSSCDYLREPRPIGNQGMI